MAVVAVLGVLAVLLVLTYHPPELAKLEPEANEIVAELTMLHEILLMVVGALVQDSAADEPPPRATSGVRGVERRSAPPRELDGWELWWKHNGVSLLSIRDRQHQQKRSELVDGVVIPTAPPVDETLDTMRSELVTALLPLLAHPDLDLASAVALALGRAEPCDAPDSTEFYQAAFEGLMGALVSSREQVQAASALALGLLHDARACDVLTSLMNDTREARESCGRKERAVPDRVRAHAALAAGLIGDAASIAHLKGIATGGSGVSRDLQASAIAALGCFDRDPLSASPSFLRWPARGLDPVAEAQVSIAHARLFTTPGAGSSGSGSYLTWPGAHPAWRISTVIEVGKLASIDRSKVVPVLLDMAANELDPDVRNFALIALADIAARTEPQDNSGLHQQIVDFTLKQLDAPVESRRLSWAALSLAIIVQGQAAEQPRAVNVLRAAFARSTSVSDQSAVALSLGLVNASEHGAWLTNLLKDSDDEELKGWIAVALGAMTYTPALDWMCEEIERAGIGRELRQQLARALALMNDVSAVPALVQLMADHDTVPFTNVVIAALGRLGGRSAFDALRGLVLDESRPASPRANAATALGVVCQRGELPWLRRVAIGANYRAQTETIAELMNMSPYAR